MSKSQFLNFLSEQYAFIENLPVDPLKLNEIIADKYKLSVVVDNKNIKKVSKQLWEYQTDTLNLIAQLKMIIDKMVSEASFNDFEKSFKYLIHLINEVIKGHEITEQEVKDYVAKMQINVKNETIDQIFKVYLKNKDALKESFKKNVFLRIFLKNLESLVGEINDSNNNN